MVGVRRKQHQTVEKGQEVLCRDAHHTGRKGTPLSLHRWLSCCRREPARRQERKSTQNTRSMRRLSRVHALPGQPLSFSSADPYRHGATLEPSAICRGATEDDDGTQRKLALNKTARPRNLGPRRTTLKRLG